MINDETQKQVAIEAYTTGAAELRAFFETLPSLTKLINPSRSTFVLPVGGAKHLLSSTKESLVFLSCCLSGRTTASALPILRSQSGDFLDCGDAYAFDVDPGLFPHAFGMTDDDEETPHQDPRNGHLWGNN